MKVIAINGSPRKNGNTSQALKIMADELEEQGIERSRWFHSCFPNILCRNSRNNEGFSRQSILYKFKVFQI